MSTEFGRFHIEGQSPTVIVTNTTETDLVLRIWQSPIETEVDHNLATVFVQLDKQRCTLHGGTPLPGGGTVLNLVIPSGETLYGVCDDIGKGGYVMHLPIIAGS